MKETLQQVEARVSQIVQSYKRLDNACNKAMIAGTMVHGGPLDYAIWTAFDNLLEHQIGSDWISWFIYDNKCGKLGLEGGTGKCNRKRIKTVKQLAKLIHSEQ